MAIAFDAASGNQVNPGSSLTTSHTCTGSNLVLVVFCVTNSGADSITGVTYNGTSLTRITIFDTAQGPWYAYYLVNPATGTHNLVVNSDRGTNVLTYAGASYTGCLQTSAVINAFASGTTSSSSSFTQAVTSTVDNCWVTLGFMDNFSSSSGGYTAGSNTTLRYNSGWSGFGDSNAVVHPAGSLTVGASKSFASWHHIAIAIAPVVSGPANLKTFNGLATASIKTINGLAIGSIKSVNGLT